MKPKKNNTKNSKKEMDDFAITLFDSLKINGYVFPKTIKDVERFEELYTKRVEFIYHDFLNFFN